MTVTVETKSNTAWSNASATVTLNKPSGTVDGDLLVALVASNSNSHTLDTVPAGWTLIREDTLAGQLNSNMHSYYKIASSEGASWDWVYSSTVGYNAGCVFRISGFESGSPIAASDGGDNVQNDGTPTYSTTTVTPSVSSSLIIMFIVATSNASSGTSGYAVATNDPTWTEQYDFVGGASNASTFAVATAVRLETSATGNPSVTLGADDTTEDSSCQLIVVSRQTTFTATITDTTTLSDAKTVIGGFNIGGTDIQYMTDSVSTSKNKIRNTQKIAAVNVLNQDKL